MEGNDIGVTLHAHTAVMFEDLLMSWRVDPEPDDEPKKRTWFKWREIERKAEVLTDDAYIRTMVRKWVPNEMPIKSLYHMVNQWHMSVEVYTYLHPDFIPEIEHWLARKGIAVRAYAYDGIHDLAQDFKYNRDVTTLFTPYEHEVGMLGMRATVARPDGTFGI